MEVIAIVEDVVVVYEAPVTVSKKGIRGGGGWGVCLPGLGTTLSSSNEAVCPLTWRIVMGGGRASPESNDDTDGLNVRIAGNSGEQRCLPQR